MNNKIKNATKKTYDNITFKSVLEKNCYILLKNAGLTFHYEPEKAIIMEGFYPKRVKIFSPKRLYRGKYGPVLELKEGKIINITYTPDFKIKYKDYIIYIDVKGMENDTYPLKKKMFLKKLEEDTEHNYLFFEPHSMLQCKQLLKYIQTL